MKFGYLSNLNLITNMLTLLFQQPKLNTEKHKPLLPSSGFTQALQINLDSTDQHLL